MLVLPLLSSCSVVSTVSALTRGVGTESLDTFYPTLDSTFDSTFDLAAGTQKTATYDDCSIGAD
jgi:hypothetical protein